jgi:hypothetical protein
MEIISDRSPGRLPASRASERSGFSSLALAVPLSLLWPIVVGQLAFALPRLELYLTLGVVWAP